MRRAMRKCPSSCTKISTPSTNRKRQDTGHRKAGRERVGTRVYDLRLYPTARPGRILAGPGVDPPDICQACATGLTPACSYSSIARHINSVIPGNDNRPSRNAATATSLAALRTIGRPGSPPSARKASDSAGKRSVSGALELERAARSQIERRERSAPSLGIGKRVLDGKAHVRDAELREQRAVDELDHRVHDRLRVHDDVDAAGSDVEQPPRFDDLEPLVHQGRRIDRDLRAHPPGGMASASSGVTRARSAAGTPRNGPPEAVRTSRLT